MSKIYDVWFYIVSDESGKLYQTTTTWEGLEDLYLDPGTEVVDYKEVEENE